MGDNGREGDCEFVHTTLPALPVERFSVATKLLSDEAVFEMRPQEG